MRELPAKILGALSDVTVGTVIVLFQLTVAERTRRRLESRRRLTDEGALPQ
jgi:hypothetical protein